MSLVKRFGIFPEGGVELCGSHSLSLQRLKTQMETANRLIKTFRSAYSRRHYERCASMELLLPLPRQRGKDTCVKYCPCRQLSSDNGIYRTHQHRSGSESEEWQALASAVSASLFSARRPCRQM